LPLACENGLSAVMTAANSNDNFARTPAPYTLAAVGQSLFRGCPSNWLVLVPPPPAKTSSALWQELAREFSIMAVPSMIQPRATAMVVCADIRDFERHRVAILEHAGILCLAERPYIGGLPGDVSVEELADRDADLSRLLRQGRIITFSEGDLRQSAEGEPANPFGLSGMLMILARLGAERIHVLFSEQLNDQPSIALFERRFLGIARVLELLPVAVEPVFG